MILSKQDETVNFLLTQMTYILLAESPIKDAFQKASLNHQAHLMANFTGAEFEPIKLMRDAVVDLAKALLSCETIEELQHAHAYIQALNTKEVLIAEQGEIVEQVVKVDVIGQS